MTFTVSLFNRVKDLFPFGKYKVEREKFVGQAILVRSQKLDATNFPSSLLAIGRAGAGVNNIPVEECSRNGIVVFNTPGANANAVKEMTLCGLFLASRGIIEGSMFVHGSLVRHDEKNMKEAVESGKKSYAGVEILGKKLGVIGLGKIGVLVANDALALGMEVVGYDPFITTETALALKPGIRVVKDMSPGLLDCDYISIHVPLTDKTKKFFNEYRFKEMKKGVRILNFSRGEIINEKDLLVALKDGTVAKYISDFPSPALISEENTIFFPHLGASTAEAEENCAKAVTTQVCDFLEKGIIRNSVNFPSIEMALETKHRLVVINRNLPGMVEKITAVIASEKTNIADMINRAKGDYAVTVIDTDTAISAEVFAKILKIEGVIKARSIDL